MKTFAIDGKFGYTLTHRKKMFSDEAPFVENTITSYLNEVGLDYMFENDLDEGGRANLAFKIKEREFEKEHIHEILDALKGDGLSRILAYALEKGFNYKTEDIQARRLGKSYGPCETCNKFYIDAEFDKTGWGSLSGFRGRDLHELAMHPDTFQNMFGNLRKIYEYIKQAEGHTPNLVYEMDLVPELMDFANKFDEKMKANAESYEFWNDTHGGVGNYEEEEYEDNPELRKMVEYEERLYDNVSKTYDKALESCIRLNEKYSQISGKKKKIEEQEMMNFWSDQLLLIQIYHLSSDKLLESNKRNNMNDLPINFRNI